MASRTPCNVATDSYRAWYTLTNVFRNTRRWVVVGASLTLLSTMHIQSASREIDHSLLAVCTVFGLASSLTFTVFVDYEKNAELKCWYSHGELQRTIDFWIMLSQLVLHHWAYMALCMPPQWQWESAGQVGDHRGLRVPRAQLSHFPRHHRRRESLLDWDQSGVLAH